MAKQIRTVQITYETDPQMEDINWWAVFEYSQCSKVLKIKHIETEGESK